MEIDFNKIYVDYIESVKRYMKFNYTLEDGDDLIQESFIQFYRYYDGSTKPITFWIHILKNKVKAKFKIQKNEMYRYDRELPESPSDAEYLSDRYEIILNEINTNKNSDVLYDFYINGYKMKDIAITYDFSFSKIKLIIFYFKKKMNEKYSYFKD